MTSRSTAGANPLWVAAPLLVLGIAGGLSAGAGIALQPDDPGEPAGPTTSVSVGAPRTLGTPPPCPSPTIAPAPTDTSSVEFDTWVAVGIDALADRVQCTDDSEASMLYPWGFRPEYVNYTGIELDDQRRHLVVYWKGPVPEVVRERMGDVPAGLRVIFDEKAPYTSDQIDRAVSLLAPGDVLGALPPLPGRAPGAPEIVLTGLVAREDGRAVEVGYAYGDGTLPPRSDVTPRDVAAPLEAIAEGLTVVAIPTPLLEP